MANSLAQYLADLQVQIKEAESQLVFGVVISTSPLRVKYGEITLEDNFLFVEDGVTLTVGQKVPLLKTNRSQLFIVMLSKEFTPQEITPEEILSKIKTVDGSGSGIDADLLDGKHASDFSLDGHTQDWTTITGKPSTFAPSAHNQSWTTITDKPTTATRWPTWSEVTSKPSTFTPSTHTHTWSQLSSGSTGLIPTSGSSGSYTSVDMSGSKGGYAGIYFTTYARYFMVNATIQGFHTGSGWQWYFNNGALTAGTVPWARLTSVPTQATRWPTWSEVTSKPSTFSPSTHTHTTGTKSTTGYVKFDNGMKINWATVTVNANVRSKTFTWASAFSSVYAYWAAGPHYDVQEVINPVSTTGGTLEVALTSNNAVVPTTTTYKVFAIGV